MRKRGTWLSVMCLGTCFGACGSEAGDGAAGQGPPPPLCVVELQCEEPIVDEPKTTCTMSIEDGSGTLVYDGFAGVEVRGRSSRSFPKKSYGLELRDAEGAEVDVDVLGMGAESDFVLDGCWADRSFMRNALAYDLFVSMSRDNYAAEGRFCEMMLNGEDVGIYRLAERVKRATSRVDLPLDDGTGQTFLIKQDQEGAIGWDVGEQGRWKLIYPKEADASPAQIAGVQAFVDGLDQAMRAAREVGDDDGVFAWLDLDAVVDWVIVEELAKNVDAYNLSLHFYRAAGGLSHPVPWDFDLSMGQPVVRDGAQDAPEGWTRHGWLTIESIAASRRFRARLTQRYRALRLGVLSDAVVMGRIDRMQVTLSAEAITRNFTRWPLAEVRLAGSLGPYELYEVLDYAEEVGALRTFLMERLAWLDANIERFPDD